MPRKISSTHTKTAAARKNDYPNGINIYINPTVRSECTIFEPISYRAPPRAKIYNTF